MTSLGYLHAYAILSCTHKTIVNIAINKNFEVE